jgi:hypothetical protein
VFTVGPEDAFTMSRSDYVPCQKAIAIKAVLKYIPLKVGGESPLMLLPLNAGVYHGRHDDLYNNFSFHVLEGTSGE